MLIVIGVVFLLAQQSRIGGEAVVAAIGLAFLVAFFYRRNYGFLVPGGVMTGWGLGIIYQFLYGASWAKLLGLGLGFIGIYVIDVLTGGRRGGQWWPLVPGGVLAAIGLLQAGGQYGITGTIGRWWPLILIAFGVYLLFRRRTEDDEDRSPTPPR
jgi:hypothetical protein